MASCVTFFFMVFLLTKFLHQHLQTQTRTGCPAEFLRTSYSVAERGGLSAFESRASASACFEASVTSIPSVGRCSPMSWPCGSMANASPGNQLGRSCRTDWRRRYTSCSERTRTSSAVIKTSQYCAACRTAHWLGTVSLFENDTLRCQSIEVGCNGGGDCRRRKSCLAIAGQSR